MEHSPITTVYSTVQYMPGSQMKRCRVVRRRWRRIVTFQIHKIGLVLHNFSILEKAKRDHKNMTSISAAHTHHKKTENCSSTERRQLHFWRSNGHLPSLPERSRVRGDELRRSPLCAARSVRRVA